MRTSASPCFNVPRVQGLQDSTANSYGNWAIIENPCVHSLMNMTPQSLDSVQEACGVSLESGTWCGPFIQWFIKLLWSPAHLSYAYAPIPNIFGVGSELWSKKIICILRKTLLMNTPGGLCNAFCSESMFQFPGCWFCGGFLPYRIGSCTSRWPEQIATKSISRICGSQKKCPLQSHKPGS